MNRFSQYRRISLSTALTIALQFVSARSALGGSGSSPPAKIRLDESPLRHEVKLATSFSPIIKKAAPSVVNIYSTRVIHEQPMISPFFNDPFLRQFFGPGFGGLGRPQTRRAESLGSGVIISEDGYILTANHVIEGAEEIKVSFAEGSKESTAKLIGSDPPTDVAVLKIEGKNLPAITITDSDKLEVGDVVLAIGNPFAVGQTVTSGIVSAKGRGGMGIVDYEDFIQTDASINPGNSGGALVDAEGRLIGINTAILSRSGGNQGIGFAVPINLACYVMERIVAEGKITRGYLGVRIQPLTPDLAKEFKLPADTGALVGEVTPKTPAAQAGRKEGDVIVEFNGKKVTDDRHLRLMAAQTLPGTRVTLKALRDGKEQTFTVKLGELPSEGLAKAGRSGGRSPSAKGDPLDGVEVTDLDASARRQLNIPNQVRGGALVVNVDPGSPAAAAGLQPGDVILEINRKPVASADEAIELSHQVKDERVLLRVWSQGGSHYILVKAGKRR